MLSEKQFRERAKSELRHIGEAVQGLAADRDLYWKLERDIIAANAHLCESHNPFLDMLRGCYADAMSARLLRLLDGDPGGISLPRVLAQLADYPQLLHNKITEGEFASDRGGLERAAASVRQGATPHVERHERTLPALAGVHRELDAALGVIVETVKTYYWIVTESYLELDVTYAEDPLSIFQFAWATPVLAR
jgi:hypothetical protein